MYAAFLAKKSEYELACLISIVSENPESFMFHTPSISQTQKQAEAMGIPIIIQKTCGDKEEELTELEEAIKRAVEEYQIKGVVTGAVESVYQATRIQKICNELGIEVFNPLWQKNQIELLSEIVKNKLEVIVTGIFAYPLGKEWLGRKIDPSFIEDMGRLQKKYKINPAGEGGEFESFVLNCPLFKKRLKIRNRNISGVGNSWRMEIRIE